MSYKQLISDVIDRVSLKTANGLVDMKDTYHVYLVQEELKNHIDTKTINKIFEAPKNKTPEITEPSTTINQNESVRICPAFLNS